MTFKQITRALRKQGFVELARGGKHPKMMGPRGEKIAVPLKMNDWDRGLANFRKKLDRMGYWLVEPKHGSRMVVAD